MLVHRRAQGLSRFPGRCDWLVGGAVAVGESYEEAAVRELGEERGRVFGVPVRFLFKFLCRGESGTYWLGAHEVVLGRGVFVPDPAEIDWCGWGEERELVAAVGHGGFVGDGGEALRRYPAG
ncbi:NUDIX domain-containing protein [Streptomyces sp. SID13726]|uniref:NUDIX domain-containing protein n=1 Tax=Streptomyces sp. SID13726 TaxID=2706058 RepID=UPI001EF2D4AA|nr:NUDIX domain-containing protein [Streptomyces sp. SID13726]